MESIYGLNHTLGMSNINNTIAMQNRNISIANQNTRDSYINAVATQKKAKSDSEGATAGLNLDQEKTDAETAVSSADLGKVGIEAFKSKALGVSELAGNPSAVTILADPNNILGMGAVRAGEGAFRSTPLAVSALDDDPSAVTILADPNNILGMGAVRAGEGAFRSTPLAVSALDDDPSAVTILADPNNILGMGAFKAGENAKGVPVVQATEVSEDVLQAGSAGGELAGAGAKAISAVKGLSVSGGLAAAGAVLEAGEGALAIGDDISLDMKSGKFDQIAGNNDWERASNVSDIAGGAAVTLLGIGTALDASIVGAPVGLALQGLAAAAGIFSGVTDYIGEQKEKSEVKPPPAAVKAPPSSVAPQAFQATGSSGQEVRVN
tara:strand:- start:1100 stop:2239 length:1140 start_codon:yes stop_codon:yes gene_type:complete